MTFPPELEALSKETSQRLAEIAAFAERPLTETGAPEVIRQFGMACWDAGRKAGS